MKKILDMHTHKPSSAQPVRSSSGIHQKSGYQLLRRRRSEKKKDTALSCRYELKYRIRESKARAMAQYVQSYIHPDRYALKQPGFEYPVSSLYFDSNELNLCKETIYQKANRFKLRIRCYDDNPESDCFVEIKRRLNTVIMKDRMRIKKEMLKNMVYFHVPGELYSKDKKVLSQFYFYSVSLRARPVVLVRYKRQAFEDDSRNRVRITFDRQLCCKESNRLEVTTNGTGWKHIPMDFVILEIKFTDRYPMWLSDMIKVFDLKQTAMSKYVSSVRNSCSFGMSRQACSMEVE